MDKKKMERRDFLINIAEMYYIKKMSQEEIAQTVDLSRSNVSRLLKQCAEENIVEFKINKDTSRIKLLETQLAEKYDLKYIKIVSGYENQEVSKKEVGRAAAEYVQSIVKDHMKIGIAWGSTLCNLVECMETNVVSKKNVSVFQMLGGTGSTDVASDGRQLTRMLSDKLEGTPFIINVPLLVQSKILRDLLLKEPQVEQHFSKMEKMDLLLMGIGSFVAENNVMYKAGYIKLEDAKEFVTERAIADLAGHSIDKNGEFCKIGISDKIINLNLDKIKAAKIRLGVAAGVNKIKPVKAVLNGKYLNAIVIDEKIANALI